ncbi:hypothetical protein ELK71_28250, partial [Klebsiella pneumoniae]|nr:hypothetical protein [Klebsiella pneumoniae]
RSLVGSEMCIRDSHSICDSELFQDYVHSSFTNRVKHSKRVKNKTEKGYIRSVSYTHLRAHETTLHLVLRDMG